MSRKQKKRSNARSKSTADSNGSQGIVNSAERSPLHPPAFVVQIVAGTALLGALLWAYWPTLGAMVQKWNNQPDYSHGYLVLPIAVYFLWRRRSEFPSHRMHPDFWGVTLLLLACVIRVVAGLYYMTPLDGWTIPLAVAGGVWMLYGRAVLRWSLPAIIFLWFMVPIPYSAETWLSVPLQAIATKLSTAALVTLGQPAISEGNTILLGEQQLGVEEACSGLRILVGIFALAFAFVLFSSWSWWQKVIVIAAAVPAAIVANVIRIVATALLYEWVSSEVSHKFSHDFAGFFMIPLAAGLFWLLLVYLDRMVYEVEDVGHLSTTPALTQ